MGSLYLVIQKEEDNDHACKVLKCLASCVKDINHDNPLQHAVKNGKFELVKILVKAGADICYPGGNDTPLKWVTEYVKNNEKQDEMRKIADFLKATQSAMEETAKSCLSSYTKNEWDKAHLPQLIEFNKVKTQQFYSFAEACKKTAPDLTDNLIEYMCKKLDTTISQLSVGNKQYLEDPNRTSDVPQDEVLATGVTEEVHAEPH